MVIDNGMLDRASAPLSLAYVSPRYAPFTGGVETHVANLARRAAARGHRVEVLTQEVDRRLPAAEVIDGVSIRRFPLVLPNPNYAFSPRLWAYLARHARHYDVVHAHSYHALPALAAALAGARPFVFTPHYHGTGHSPLRRFLHRPYRPLGAATFARAAAVICVSAAEAALVRGHFPHAADRVVVIPNGVDVRALRAAEPLASDETVILSVGRLETYKNVQQCIEALAQLDERFVLRVVGDGPARADLERLTARLGLQRRVRFLGRVSDELLHRWYRTAAVYVTCSAHEAFGITLMEALVAGTAVVATDIPAHREAARMAPGAMTLTPRATTPARLAEAIAVRSRRPPHAWDLELADWDTIAARTERLYRGVARAAL